MPTTSESGPSLLLVPIGAVDAATLAPLAPPLGREFDCDVWLHMWRTRELDAAFDRARTQCDATRLLLGLLSLFPWPQKVVGVTATDLAVPAHEWVFGQAQVQGRAAVVSTHRLAEAFYGRAPDPVVEQQRLYTEIGHETGHTFGLGHCDAPACLMRWSRTVEEIEAKGWTLCEACAARVRAPRGGDAGRRRAA